MSADSDRPRPAPTRTCGGSVQAQPARRQQRAESGEAACQQDGADAARTAGRRGEAPAARGDRGQRHHGDDHARGRGSSRQPLTSRSTSRNSADAAPPTGPGVCVRGQSGRSSVRSLTCPRIGAAPRAAPARAGNCAAKIHSHPEQLRRRSRRRRPESRSDFAGVYHVPDRARLPRSCSRSSASAAATSAAPPSAWAPSGRDEYRGASGPARSRDAAAEDDEADRARERRRPTGGVRTGDGGERKGEGCSEVSAHATVGSRRRTRRGCRGCRA